MITFFPVRESSSEGRRRLSRGSLELHTRQWQPSEGTPMEVPEPSTVTLIGAAGFIKEMASAAERSQSRGTAYGRVFAFAGVACAATAWLIST